MSDTEVPMTRRQYLTVKVMLEGALNGMPTDIFTAIEAVSSTAIEHPEWDMEEEHTYTEWEKFHG